MPKSIYKIEAFHGGLNNNDDPRDIAPDEQSELQDVVVNEVGKIRLLGGTIAHTEVPAAPVATLVDGYGLFTFSTDHVYNKIVIRASADISGDVVSGHYISDASSSNTVVYITNVSTDTITGRIVGRDLQGTTVEPFANGVTIYDKGDSYGGTPVSTSKTVNTTPSITEEETGEDWLACWDGGSDVAVDLYDRTTTDVWRPGALDLGSTTGAKPVYYFADGILRVSDGNFNNTNKWWGWIKRTHFSGLSPAGSADSWSDFYSKNQEIAKPTRGLFGPYILGTASNDTDSDGDNIKATQSNAFSNLQTEVEDAHGDSEWYITLNANNDQATFISTVTDAQNIPTPTLASSATWQNDNYYLFPSPGKGFNINAVANTGVNGSWEAGDYEIATSFIYENNQESLLFENIGDGDRLAIAANNGLDVVVLATSPYDNRLTGGRVYIREYNSTEKWSLLVEISLKSGVRANEGDNYSVWALEAATGVGDAPDTVYLRSISLTILHRNPLTYEIINGWSQDTSSLYAQYKTAVIANRMVYIGNVKITNEDGENQVMGDAMIKSPVNKFDTFPITRMLEASVRDGDEIVKLETYADRILQFKKNKLHIINISQDVEFLEDTFEFKGLLGPTGVCKTDYGIAWANRRGLYLYNGRDVLNLLEENNKRKISEFEWYSFFTQSKDGASALLTPKIAYFPEKRQLLIFDHIAIGGSISPRVYLYDMVTKSFTTGAVLATRILDKNKTNFVVDWNGDIIYGIDAGSTTTFYKWSNLPVASDFVRFLTKDIDFGQPAVRKKVYKVYISYKGNAAQVVVHYGVDGLAPALTFNSITSGTDGSSTGSGTADKCIPYDAGTTDWLKAELKPSVPINNINSFRLLIKGDGSNDISSDFEINDISIVYRLKNIK